MLAIQILAQVYIESQQKVKILEIDMYQSIFYVQMFFITVNCEWSEWETVQPCNNTCRAGSIRWNRTVVVEAEHGGGCSDYYGRSVDGKNGTIDTSFSYCNMLECPSTIHI